MFKRFKRFRSFRNLESFGSFRCFESLKLHNDFKVLEILEVQELLELRILRSIPDRLGIPSILDISPKYLLFPMSLVYVKLFLNILSIPEKLSLVFPSQHTLYP